MNTLDKCSLNLQNKIAKKRAAGESERRCNLRLPLPLGVNRRLVQEAVDVEDER